MVSMRDLEEVALEDARRQPGTAPRRPPDLRGRPQTVLLSCTKRRDALDPATGEPLDDVLVFSVADEEMKSMWLSQRPTVYFTTDHFNGYSAILVRIASLADIDLEELTELVSDAWLARAPKRLAQKWLADQGLGEDSD
jgi:hypothetical protein